MLNHQFLKIEKISVDNVREYIFFFNNVPHDSVLDEFSCFYLEPCDGRRFVLPSPKDNKREKASAKEVSEGKLGGYLAFEDGGCIGFCNANVKSRCMKRSGYKHFLKGSYKAPEDDAHRILSVFYFVTDPDFQYVTIPQLILDRLCSDALDEGFEFVEAYPYRDSANFNTSLTGNLAFYVKNGFYIAHTAEDHFVVRKKLR